MWVTMMYSRLVDLRMKVLLSHSKFLATNTRMWRVTIRAFVAIKYLLTIIWDTSALNHFNIFSSLESNKEDTQ